MFHDLCKFKSVAFNIRNEIYGLQRFQFGMKSKIKGIRIILTIHKFVESRNGRLILTIVEEEFIC